MFKVRSFGRVISVCAVLTGLVLIGGCGKEANQHGAAPPPPPVSVAEVIVRDVVPSDVFNGRIEAVESVQLRPQVGGVIEQVRYREGDIIKKGELLFVIDQRPFRADLERAEAELARANAQANLARMERQRAVDLYARKLISTEEHDQRLATEAQADANVRAAEAAVRLARLDLEYTRIRAPITGRTGRALFTVGNLVASEPTPDVLTTIVSLDPVYVYFDSDELTYLRHAGSARQAEGKDKGPVVFVSVGNEADFPRKGYVDFVDNQVDPRTGTIRLRAVLENKDYQLTPGQFARIKLLASAPVQAVLIDDKAILTDQDRKYVYVLGPENRAMRRDIQIGQVYEGLRNVISGLEAGEKIIVHGVQKVFFPGMPVTPQMITMGDPPPAPPGPPAGH
ncbi:MAG: efflux RND transporter periplasmic adaptor subunit [Pseudomonadota bacterium]